MEELEEEVSSEKKEEEGKIGGGSNLGDETKWKQKNGRWIDLRVNEFILKLRYVYIYYNVELIGRDRVSKV